MHGTLDCGLRGRFEREAALARSTRPGDRDEANVGPGEEGLRSREVVAPADEAVVEGGQHRASERRKRREALGEAGRNELIERSGARGRA